MLSPSEPPAPGCNGICLRDDPFYIVENSGGGSPTATKKFIFLHVFFIDESKMEGLKNASEKCDRKG
jgi:hypothetical protein